MKKKIMFILVIVISTISLKSQTWPIDEKTGEIVFTEVIQMDSLSKDQVYAIVKEWIAVTYKDASEVIQMDDKESGKLICKAVIPVVIHSLGARDAGVVKYDLTFLI
jgi:hypothetical protein